MDDGNTERQYIAELEYRFIGACLKRDTQALDKILADDFVFTDPAGLNLTKSAWLADLISGDFKFDTIRVDELRVHLSGDTASVHASITLKARSKKAGYEGTYSAVDVYFRRNEGWRLSLSSANKVVT